MINSMSQLASLLDLSRDLLKHLDPVLLIPVAGSTQLRVQVATPFSDLLLVLERELSDRVLRPNFAPICR
jgi:hypothetical protein